MCVCSGAIRGSNLNTSRSGIGKKVGRIYKVRRNKTSKGKRRNENCIKTIKTKASK